VQQTVDKLSGLLNFISTILPEHFEVRGGGDIERGDFDPVVKLRDALPSTLGFGLPLSCSRTCFEEKRGGAVTVPRSPPARSTPRAGRVGVVVVLIVSLVLAGLTSQARRSARRQRPRRARQRFVAGQHEQLRARLAARRLARAAGHVPVDPISKTSRTRRNLEDFDTYVEWIRLLQPEFDTVHIFQVWNKAYNISVPDGGRCRTSTARS
jgi:type II secretory pathway pseudopilin PulG